MLPPLKALLRVDADLHVIEQELVRNPTEWSIVRRSFMTHRSSPPDER